MKLYRVAPQDNSGKVSWLLNELNLPFDFVTLNYQNGETKNPDYLTKHPLGQVPYFEDGSTKIFESYAICTYLADRYIDKGFAPAFTNYQARAEYYKWMFFTANSVDSFFNKYKNLANMNDEYKSKWGTYIQEKFMKVLSTLETQLTGKDYVLTQFSAVDCCLGYSIDAFIDEPYMSDFPNTKKYYERLKTRPACLKSEVFKR